MRTGRQTGSENGPAPPTLAARVRLAGRRPPSAVVFGPHVTNLGTGRSLSAAHAEYYAERAAGGAGIIVTETASVHPSDHPYERAPLAAECADGWRAIAGACRPHGAVVLAALGHRGLEGTSAHHQRPLWGPSAVADPAGREVPAVMEPDEIAAVVAGFVQAARVAVEAGCDGVEVDAGPRSLLRQFCSELTNRRDDAYGRDRGLLLAEVLAAVRRAMGGGRALAVRLTCDEGVSWGGITPDSAAELIGRIAAVTDLVTAVRGGLYTPDEYRPGMHVSPGFNRELCRRMRVAAAGVPVVLQGSIVDPREAQRALDDAAADVVEMTRAQIAEPRTAAAARAGHAPRPCLLCNQGCMVDDPRNPLIDCVVRPRPAEAEPRVPSASARHPRRAVILGGGVAGLSAARTLAASGAEVTVLERADRTGGVLRTAAAARSRMALLADWLERECTRLGVTIACGVADGAERAAAAAADGVLVVQATGGTARPPDFPCESWAEAADVLGAAVDVDGPVLVRDPIGGPTGVAVTEFLAARGADVAIVTPDPVAGAGLARAGDLAGANVRLQRAGVARHVFSTVREQRGRTAVLEHVHTGERREVACSMVVDCAPRLPGPVIDGAVRVGDCVAPRTALEAVRDGIEAGSGAGDPLL